MTAAKPPCCPICGLCFTTHIYFYGRRCLEPDHWLAAGLLTPADYIPLSQLAALAATERGRQSLMHGGQHAPVRP